VLCVSVCVSVCVCLFVADFGIGTAIEIGPHTKGRLTHMNKHSWRGEAREQASKQVSKQTKGQIGGKEEDEREKY